MDKNKKIITFVIIAVLLAIAAFAFILTQNVQDDAPDNQNTPINNVHDLEPENKDYNEPDYTSTNTSGTYVESTSNITNDNANEPGFTPGQYGSQQATRIFDENDFEYPYDDATVDSSNRESERIYAENERKIAQVNQAAAKSNANNFIKNFFTYNANSLKNDYIGTWSKYCTSNALHGETSDIINQHGMSAWINNSATYSEVWSRAYDISVGDVLWSVYDTPYVIVTAIVEENAANLGMPGGTIVNKNKNRYAVYVDNNGLVTDVKKQKSDTIQSNIFNTQMPHEGL